MILEEKLNFSSKTKGMFFGIAGLGLVLVIIGLLVGEGSTRFWSSYLLGNFFFTAISITALLWIAVSYVSKSGWNIVLKRVKEAMSGYFIIGGIAFAIMMIATFIGDHNGMKAVFEWAHLDSAGFLHHPDGTKEFDPVIFAKSGYLNITFFIIRNIIYFVGWYVFYRILRKLSIQEDAALSLTPYKKAYRLSAGFLPFYGVTFCLFSIDWAMSLEPHWYSTMFEVNVFAGALVSTFTIIALIAYILKSKGYMSYVNENHFHDLGKLIFGFSIFWAYTWVGQFLLIWYANIPEEVPYYYTRMHDNWAPVFWANLIINFICPFLLLMMRDSKRNMNYLISVCILLLVGRFIDWYLMIMPGAAGDAAGIGFFEIGFFFFFAGIFGYTVMYKLSQASLVPRNHPLLVESIHHEI